MHRVLLALFFLTAPVAAQAQCTQTGDITARLPAEARAALDADVANTAYGEGLFWSATKDGTDLSIFGTMHLPDPRHDAFLSRIETQLSQADLLLVEATLDDQKAMQTHMARNTDLVTLPAGGPTLPELVGDDIWPALRDAAQARGIPGFMAAKMQPWFLATSLSVPPCAMAAMTSGSPGLDAMIMARAADLGVPVAPLEPWQNMFDLLTGGTLEEQIDALRIAAIAPDLQDEMMSTVIDSYFDENTARTWHIAGHLQPLFPSIPQEEYAAQISLMEADLLVARNHDWIPVIESAAAVHDALFIAFGAAHLIGEDGVLNLLAEAGWTISRLP